MTIMKNYLLIFILIFIFFLTVPPSNSIASDEDGCLICHRYPGLVRTEKGEGGDRFMVLDIDEASYLSSPHGKLNCRKCHTQITKVPHTGQTAINCNTKCHLDKKDKKLIKNFPLAGFHKKEQSYIVSLEAESACTTCHTNYPHYEDKVVRAFLNMHTGFIKCIVCHVKRERYKDIQFDWEKPEKVKFSGKSFGSYYDPNTGKARQSGDLISRIGAFVVDGGRKDILVHPGDIEKAKEFLSNKSLSEKDKKSELEYFHKDIEKKEISMVCEECHSSNSILDFDRLGFSERKKENLININIKGLIVKYKNFYLPMFLND